MQDVLPLTLNAGRVRLEPMSLAHAAGLRAAAQDGALWKIRVTSVPEPHNMEQYIATALGMDNRLAFAVVDAASGTVMGTTSYHDIVPHIERLEIGWTWYGARYQRTHVNTSCKIALLTHAFETLGCAVVGLRTDIFNHASQAAIERLGAKKDGVLRHHHMRRDGTVRDTVMYSIVRGEWPEVKGQLHYRLNRHTEKTPC